MKQKLPFKTLSINLWWKVYRQKFLQYYGENKDFRFACFCTFICMFIIQLLFQNKEPYVSLIRILTIVCLAVLEITALLHDDKSCSEIILKGVLLIFIIFSITYWIGLYFTEPNPNSSINLFTILTGFGVITGLILSFRGLYNFVSIVFFSSKKTPKSQQEIRKEKLVTALNFLSTVTAIVVSVFSLINH